MAVSAPTTQSLQAQLVLLTTLRHVDEVASELTCRRVFLPGWKATIRMASMDTGIEPSALQAIPVWP
ncbi:hypothetical protein LshimejAT787_1601800 [Lyophyllum shimeji]|uniref:Uncharacterized protein n=1 Tax=Lyophyllum shimeji TaxID=47721 RepID=A0A9P3PWG4_LYOSH|nr:hypothetical protein LshimejAT787_1601800 [Lyophyllum shimeji]